MSTFLRSERGGSARALHYQPQLLLLLLFLFCSPLLLLLPGVLLTLLLQLPRLQAADALRLYAAASVVRCGRPVSPPSAAASTVPCCLLSQQQTPAQELGAREKPEQQPQQQRRGCCWQQQQELLPQQQSVGRPLQRSDQQQQRRLQQKQGHPPEYWRSLVRTRPQVLHCIPTSASHRRHSQQQHRRTARGKRCNSSRSTYGASRVKVPSSSDNNSSRSNSTADSEKVQGSGRHIGSRSEGRNSRTSNTKNNSRSHSSSSKTSSSATSSRSLHNSSSSKPLTPRLFPSLLCLSRVLGDDAGIAADSAVSVAAGPYPQTLQALSRPLALSASCMVQSLVSRRKAAAAGFLVVALPAAAQLPAAAVAMVCCRDGNAHKSCLRCDKLRRDRKKPRSACFFCCVHEHGGICCRKPCTSLSSTRASRIISVSVPRSHSSSRGSGSPSSTSNNDACSGDETARCRRGMLQAEGLRISVQVSRLAATCGREETAIGVSSDDAAAAKVAAVEDAFLSVVRSARIWLALKSNSFDTPRLAGSANAASAAPPSAAAAAATGGVAAVAAPGPASANFGSSAAAAGGAPEAASPVTDTGRCITAAASGVAAAAAEPAAATPSAATAAGFRAHVAWQQLQEAVTAFHRVARQALNVPAPQLQPHKRGKLQCDDATVQSSKTQQQDQEVDLQKQSSQQSQNQQQRGEQPQSSHHQQQQQWVEEARANGTHLLGRGSSTKGSCIPAGHSATGSPLKGDRQKKSKKRGRSAADNSSTEDASSYNSTAPLVWYDEGKRKLMVDRQQLLREKGETSRGSWTLRFLGTGSMQSSLSRNTSAILFTKGDGVSWLFDCGGGPSAATLPPPSSSPFKSRSSPFNERLEAVAAGREGEPNGDRGAVVCQDAVPSDSFSFLSPAAKMAAGAPLEASTPSSVTAAVSPQPAAPPQPPPAAAVANLCEAGTAAAAPPVTTSVRPLPSRLQTNGVACTSAAHADEKRYSAASEADSAGVGSAVAAAGRTQTEPAAGPAAAGAAAASAADSAAAAAPVLLPVAAPANCSTLSSYAQAAEEDTPEGIAAAAAIAVAAAAIRGAVKSDASQDIDFHAQPRKKRVSRIAAVFITHLHGDHVLGLPSLLSQIAASPALQLQEGDCSSSSNSSNGKKQLDEAGDLRRGSEAQPLAPEDAEDAADARDSAASCAQRQQFPVVEIYGPQGLRSLLRAMFLGTYVRRCAPYRVHEFKEVPCLHHAHPGGRRCQHAVLPELPQTPFEIEGGRNIPARPDGTYEAHEEAGANVLAVPIRHIVPTVGYVVEETGRTRRRLNAAAVSPLVERNAAALALLPALQGQPKAVFKVLSNLMPGESYTFPDGTTLQHEDVFEEETQQLRKFCLCLDTCDASTMTTYIRNCDVMVKPQKCSSVKTPGLHIHESTLCETGRAGGSKSAMEVDGDDASRRVRGDGELGPDYCSSISSSRSSNNASSNNSVGTEKKKVIWENTRGTCRRRWSAADEEAFPRGHSTAALAGDFAGRVGARRLVLTHFSQRYKGDASLTSAVVMQQVEQEALESLLRAECRGSSQLKRLDVVKDRTAAARCTEKTHSSPLQVLAAFDGLVLHIPQRRGL